MQKYKNKTAEKIRIISELDRRRHFCGSMERKFRQWQNKWRIMVAVPDSRLAISVQSRLYIAQTESTLNKLERSELWIR